MIKISHEVPLALLERSREFNDYDYALVHLFEKYPQYLEFFKKSLSMGREVILDNSIFELEEAFYTAGFAKWVQELKPTKYIIPDSLDNAVLTIKNLHEWINTYSHLPGKKIGVVQGRTINDLIECYKEIDKYCDEIAISFNYLVYEEVMHSGNKLKDWMHGRIELIEHLQEERILNEQKPHHLLGCSLPQEFSSYKNKPYICSLDTSNPIVHGLKGIRYSETGLKVKEGVKLVDLLESDVSDKQLGDILFNVNKFKQLVNGK